MTVALVWYWLVGVAVMSWTIKDFFELFSVLSALPAVLAATLLMAAVTVVGLGWPVLVVIATYRWATQPEDGQP